jgi:uncharacterized damage-inducible protein DinB
MSSAIEGLKSALEIFAKDLAALPEEAYQKSFGGQARTAADIAHEVVMVNDDVRRNMVGEPMIDWPSGWLRAPEGLQTKAEAIANFQRSAAELVAAVETWGPDDLAVTVANEHGEHTREERCQFLALHLWYHAGQLNFMQTLLGDTEWHWKD